jgi:hypothetical protein
VNGNPEQQNMRRQMASSDDLGARYMMMDSTEVPQNMVSVTLAGHGDDQHSQSAICAVFVASFASAL